MVSILVVLVIVLHTYFKGVWARKSAIVPGLIIFKSAFHLVISCFMHLKITTDLIIRNQVGHLILMRSLETKGGDLGWKGLGPKRENCGPKSKTGVTGKQTGTWKTKVIADCLRGPKGLLLLFNRTSTSSTSETEVEGYGHSRRPYTVSQVYFSKLIIAPGCLHALCTMRYAYYGGFKTLSPSFFRPIVFITDNVPRQLIFGMNARILVSICWQ